jgi:HSP20 family protein
MTMTRRPSDRSVVPLRTALERFMDWPFTQVDAALTELAPPIDVRESGDAYLVEIDLPGIDAKDTEVLVEGRTLTVRGQYSREQQREEGGYLLRERRSGDFVRAIALPGMVDPEGAESTFENGLLTIKLPKAAQNRARRIEVRGNGHQKLGSGSGGSTQAATQAASHSQATTGQSHATTRQTEPATAGRQS